MNPSLPFRLRLFGGPALVGPDGAPLTGRAAQRHRLALLALLARAPATGVSRDVLMAYLWPDSDLPQARNRLKVSVYVLRQALGEDAILSAGDALRLAPGTLDVDVWAFEAALSRGDHEAAVALYEGPFLEGLGLKEAPEFDQWIDRERARLAGQVAGALEALAEGAQERGDGTTAVQWWKSRAALDPYDSRVALRLMQALAAAGSRAGALQHATVHRALLKQELGIEPAAEVRALAERLRTEPEPVSEAAQESLPVFRASPPFAVSPEAPGVAAASTEAADEGSRGRSRWAFPLAAVLAAGVVLLAVLGPRSDSAVGGASPDRSLVVLPLVNRGEDPMDAARADGMTDELISALSGAGLRVISSTTAFAFRDPRADVRHIADSLGVAYVLEGDWQTLGPELRVRVRLVDGRDGAVRWSRDYLRPLGDLFATREDIARAVLREIGARPEEIASRGSAGSAGVNVAAWELYRRASRGEVLRSDVTAEEALDLMKRAIELDPTFAAAHAGLARLRLRIGTPDDPDARGDAWLRLARSHAVTAIELDRTLSDGHAALGLVEMWSYGFEPAEAHLLRAVELDPSDSRPREWLVQLYVWTGRVEEALEQAQRGIAIDPLSASARAELARALAVAGRCDAALAELAVLADLDPPLLRAGPIAAQCHAERGQWDEALAEIRRRLPATGLPGQAGLAHFLARAGRTDEARVILAQLLAAPEMEAFGIASVYVGLGELDLAFEWLGRSIEDQSFNFEIMEPRFAPLRGDPRFPALLARIGLPAR